MNSYGVCVWYDRTVEHVRTHTCLVIYEYNCSEMKKSQAFTYDVGGNGKSFNKIDSKGHHRHHQQFHAYSMPDVRV